MFQIVILTLFYTFHNLLEYQLFCEKHLCFIFLVQMMWELMTYIKFKMAGQHLVQTQIPNLNEIHQCGSEIQELTKNWSSKQYVGEEICKQTFSSPKIRHRRTSHKNVISDQSNRPLRGTSARSGTSLAAEMLQVRVHAQSLLMVNFQQSLCYIV